MKINEYIDSGILEAYLFGNVTEEESAEFLRFKEEYPEVKTAFKELEHTMELFARGMGKIPPPGLLTQIEANIKEVVLYDSAPLIIKVPHKEPEVIKANPGEFIQNKETVPFDIEPPLIPIGKSIFYYIAFLGTIFLIIALIIFFIHLKDQQDLEQIKTEMRMKR
ncbi:hypothetical protein [Pedobacter metabolipauper]|uniref:Uncharacterized protein n=1 Tax=Pedobacter metabolipauper TaxID=425513 RepID=A0A4R6T0J2_9SPHI|nr:hypothetical protein [Pedobacter metabolipauper]TDQ11897.1 hypothetical protein ATK78_1027 [Pedobacter metabolipauper]